MSIEFSGMDGNQRSGDSAKCSGTDAKHVSVIIPVHNGGKTLARCLESVFKSSFLSFECIVADDNSYDDSLQIAEKYGARIVKVDAHKGAAYARNRGAEAAEGDILLFVDSDVEIYPDCIEKVAGFLAKEIGIAAVFGSYDDDPASRNFLSQYKNLFHHYIHQTSREDAGTFWTACGAIRKAEFFELGMFNENVRMMEDIELGYRLKARNHHIYLHKGLLVKHLKYYSLRGLIRSDLFDRAIPWTLLILSEKGAHDDLNLKLSHKVSAIIAVLLPTTIIMAMAATWFLWAVPVLLSFFYLLNRHFYHFYAQKRGVLFALKVIPLHLLYYLYSVVGYVTGHWQYYLHRMVI